MLDQMLRGPKERVLGPFAARLFSSVNPTIVTLLAAGVGVLAAGAAWQQAYSIALALWALNRLLDGFDGTLARKRGRQTDLGGYLDMLLDTLVYALIPFGLALAANTTEGYLALALLLGSFYVNSVSWMYLAAVLEKRQAGASARGELTSVAMPGGLIEGAETILFFTLFLLLPGWLVPLFIIMAVLTLATTMQRVIWAAKTLQM